MAKKYRKKNTFRNCPSTETCTPPPGSITFPMARPNTVSSISPATKIIKKKIWNTKPTISPRRISRTKPSTMSKPDNAETAPAFRTGTSKRVSASTRPALIRMGTFFLPNTGLGNIIAPSLAKTRRKRLRETTISVNI